MLSADDLLDAIRATIDHPATVRELMQRLHLPREQRVTLRRRLASLVERGALIKIRGHRYGLPDRMQLVTGRVQVHPRGFGFVTPDHPVDGARGDLYIAGANLNQAMHGDRVVARVERQREPGRADGRIVRVLERATTTLVGRYEAGDFGVGFVVPFDRRLVMDVQIPSGDRGDATPGDMVEVELTRWPTPTRTPVGRVIDVLGDIDAPGVDTRIMMRKHGIPDAHDADAVAEARRLGAEVRPKDRRGRTDFRKATTVTIDGESARDFDDAITLERLPNGNFWLGVHIADVSHYVPEGAPSTWRPTRAAPRSISQTAPSICFHRSSRPASAASILVSIVSCSRA